MDTSEANIHKLLRDVDMFHFWVLWGLVI